MQLEGKIYVGNKPIKVINIERKEPELPFYKQVENCLLDICHELNISPPIWMQKNTTEFARFHKTFFTNEQFIESLYFDKLQITWLDDGKNI